MPAIFDGPEVLERVGGDRELLAELLELLREECEHLVPAIHEAVAAADEEELEQAAHKLKGSVGQLAAIPAYRTARELELMGRSGELTGARESAVRLEQEIESLLAALTEFAARPEAS